MSCTPWAPPICINNTFMWDKSTIHQAPSQQQTIVARDFVLIGIAPKLGMLAIVLPNNRTTQAKTLGHLERYTELPTHANLTAPQSTTRVPQRFRHRIKPVCRGSRSARERGLLGLLRARDGRRRRSHRGQGLRRRRWLEQSWGRHSL
jgi:hypothetical protein